METIPVGDPETDQNDAAPEPKKTKSRSLGRRLATGIVGIAALYLIGVGTASVVPQIFWPEEAALSDDLTCAQGVSDLRGDLLDHSAGTVSTIGGPPRNHRSFFERWDRRHFALESRCAGGEHEAWELLGRLRQRMQSSLERMDAEEGHLARRVDNALSEASHAP